MKNNKTFTITTKVYVYKSKEANRTLHWSGGVVKAAHRGLTEREIHKTSTSCFGKSLPCAPFAVKPHTLSLNEGKLGGKEKKK